VNWVSPTTPVRLRSLNPVEWSARAALGSEYVPVTVMAKEPPGPVMLPFPVTFPEASCSVIWRDPVPPLSSAKLAGGH
jgi:hypothetical protein